MHNRKLKDLFDSKMLAALFGIMGIVYLWVVIFAFVLQSWMIHNTGAAFLFVSYGAFGLYYGEDDER